MAPRSGKNSILLVQRSTAALGSDAFLLGHLTEHSHNKENELIDEQTKFGRILGYGNTTESFEMTAYGDPTDPGQNAVGEALDNEEQIKIWEVDTQLNKNGKHDAIFAYALVESSEKSSPSDTFDEYSSTLQVIGKSQKGELDPLPDEVLKFAQYEFEEPGETTGDFGMLPDEEDAEGASVQMASAYDSMTVEELKQIARDNDIPGYSSMNKAELVEAVRNYIEQA